MIIHPDLRLAVISTPDRAHLAVSCLGAETGPATIIYLHSPSTNPGYWGPLSVQLHTQLDGRISQLTYHQRTVHRRRAGGNVTSASLSATGAGDLDTVLDSATGAIVLVAHSAASRLVLSWVEEYPGRARTVAGIVLLNPTLEFPDNPVDPAGRAHDELLNHFYMTPGGSGSTRCGVNEPLADRFRLGTTTYRSPELTDTTLGVLRCVPTWMLTGALDPLIPPHRCQALAEQVWADYDCVPGAGHSLPYVDPRRASQPILAALEVAYRAHLRYGGEP